MSVSTFSYSPPTDLRGLEDYIPEEMQGFVNELIRRDEQRFTGLINAIRNQCIVDTSLLPSVTSGASTASDAALATQQDVEDTEIMSIMWRI